MDSGSSFKSLESLMEEGHVGEIEMCSTEIHMGHQTNSHCAASTANHGTNLSTQKEEAHRDISDPMKQDVTRSWGKAIVLMAFTSVAALLGVSYTSKNGIFLPESLFGQHSKTFLMFLIILMIAFYIAIIGVIFGQSVPILARVFNLVSFVSMILSFTVLLSALLPPDFSFVPWIFFTFTLFAMLGVLIYECDLQI